MTNDNTGAALPHASCILITTDGSCQPNPGPGGYAAVLRRYVDGKEVTRMERKGGATATTNNRMELAAAIAALKVIKRDESLPIFVRTDSKYLTDNWRQRLQGWIAGDWRKADGKPVENADLWQELVRLCDGLNVTFDWVRGHAGDPLNKEADRLARKACAAWAQKAVLELFGQPA